MEPRTNTRAACKTDDGRWRSGERAVKTSGSHWRGAIDTCGFPAHSASSESALPDVVLNYASERLLRATHNQKAPIFNASNSVFSDPSGQFCLPLVVIVSHSHMG